VILYAAFNIFINAPPKKSFARRGMSLSFMRKIVGPVKCFQAKRLTSLFIDVINNTRVIIG
jgi:hypothetical protein